MSQTSLDMTRGLLEDRRTLWVVAALIVVLFAIANLPWQLDDYDQAKQAFTSFEMVKEGPLALSAHAARTSRDKAAVSRLDLSCAFRGDAIVGNRMAFAVACRCARARVRVIPRC